MPKLEAVTSEGVSVCSLAFSPLRFASTCHVVMFTLPVACCAVVTVAVTLAVCPLNVALMVVAPSATPLASPDALIVATLVSEEDHVAEEVTFAVEPLLYCAVAVNCCVEPASKLAFAGVTVMPVTVAA